MHIIKLQARVNASDTAHEELSELFFALADVQDSGASS